MNPLIPLLIMTAAWALAIVALAVREYVTTPGTSPLTAFKNSATIMWADTLQVVGAVLTAVSSYADIINDPNTASLIHEWLPDKQYSLAIVIIGLVTKIARERTL